MGWSTDLNAQIGKDRPRPQILKPVEPLPERCYHDPGGCERCEDRRGVSPGPTYRYVEVEPK